MSTQQQSPSLGCGLEQPAVKISQRRAAIWNLHQLGLVAPFSTAEDAVRGVVAVQAQDYQAASEAVALRTTQSFDPAALLQAESSLVRMWTVRGTLHLVHKAEAAYHQVATAESWFSRWGRFLNKHLPRPRDEVKRNIYPRIAEVLQDRPLGYREIAKVAQLQEPYVRLLPHLMKDLCYLGWCVRGAGDGRRAVYWRASYPQVPGLEQRMAQAWLFRRFLERYGPVTLADIVYWSGFRVPVVKELVQAIASELVLVAIDGQDKPAFLLAKQLPLLLSQLQDLVLLERYLPAYDVLLLAYRDKARFLQEQHLRRVFLSAARVCPIVLRDGQVAGTWRRGVSGEETEWFERQGEY